jgi:ubiquinone/menaquinone biosynthesis C-methylase UbiE
MANRNIDPRTVEGFGAEWSRFDQSVVSDDHRTEFAAYFRVFPWGQLPTDAVGFDLGCGSGRWARLVAPRVGVLHCIEPSPAALEVAKRNLTDHPNTRFHLGGVDEIPLPDDSMDFGYALGVLHHIPDPQAGLTSCTRKLKPGAPFLVYLYYAFDNRQQWFRMVWRASDLLRRAICRLPFSARYATSQIIATTVYWPLARLSLTIERANRNPEHMPLSSYRHKSFYTMRTDALDRFGTRIEKRFSAVQIRAMMVAAGLEDIVFSDQPPYWCAAGRKVANVALTAHEEAP